ncbi:N-acetylglucosamine kinase [Streptomyces minutiscleroticus]|uniref:N-acetylglucosamine kinase n=1 Tax=Streptomyces minutiscleroticus TaxID=68238 RepID=UPI00331D52C8
MTRAGADRGPRRAVLGVDSGGSGLRVALGLIPSPGPAAGSGADSADGPDLVAAGRSRTEEPVRTGPRGIDPGHLAEQLLPRARDLMARTGVTELSAVAIGAAGMATLGDALRAELPAALARDLGVRRLALAADAVTAYAGALGARPGAVIAAGTGLIAVGTDLGSWRRADGWGHLLGDCGGGAWIGRAGLEAALREHDGRTGGSAALLARAEALLGPAAALPGRLYPRPDRPAVLASFAPEVAACAAGDPVAAGILRAAAGHMADSAAAVCPGGRDARIALTGGLSRLGDALLVPLREELARRVPHARQVPPSGDPLDGALRIAADLAAGTLTLPRDTRMLHVAADG